MKGVNRIHFVSSVSNFIFIINLKEFIHFYKKIFLFKMHVDKYFGFRLICLSNYIIFIETKK